MNLLTKHLTQIMKSKMYKKRRNYYRKVSIQKKKKVVTWMIVYCKKD